MYVIAVVMCTQGQRNRSIPTRYAEVYFKQFQKLTLFIAKKSKFVLYVVVFVFHLLDSELQLGDYSQNLVAHTRSR